MIKYLSFFTALLCATVVLSQNLADTSFYSGLATSSTVYSTVVQPDGKIIVGGNFDTYSGIPSHMIARLNADGSLDTTFDQGPESSTTYGALYTLLLQPDGKILIGGGFNLFRGLSISYLARLNPDGTLDETFDAQQTVSDAVYAMVLQPDGKIVVGGGLTCVGGNPCENTLKRLNSDGSPDTTFNPGGTGASSWIYTIQQEPDGQFLIGGEFTYYNGVPIIRMARINSDGSLDQSFNPGSSLGVIRDIEILPGGGYLAAGDLSSYYGIQQLDSSGNQVGVFMPENLGDIHAMLLQPDGKLIVSGTNGNNVAGESTPVIRLNADGTNDLSFDAVPVQFFGSPATVQSLTQPSATSLLVGGSFTTFSTINRNGIARLFVCNSSVTEQTVTTGSTSYTWAPTNTTYTSSGIYTDSLVNVNGCDSVIVLNLTLIPYTVSPSVQSSDPTTCTGIVSATISGVAPFTVSLNGAVLTAVSTNQFSIDSVCPGSYSLVVVDANNDTLTSLVAVDTIPVLTITPTVQPSDADTCTGMVSVEISGVAPFTASLNGVVLTAVSANEFSLDSVCTGSYLLLVTDGNNDTLTSTVIVAEVVPLAVNVFTQASEEDTCTGVAYVTISGNPPYTVLLDTTALAVGSASQFAIDSLCAGIYSLQVIDGNYDTLVTTVVVASTFSFILNDPFSGGEIILDSLSTLWENCDIDYSTIDTAYIDSFYFTGPDTVVINWAIVDATDTSIVTSLFILVGGEGDYYLQCQLYCPQKSTNDYFVVTEGVRYLNGSLSTAGVNEQPALTASIYPNPTSSSVTIHFPAASAHLVITDVQGHSISSQTIYNGDTLSLQQLRSGIYFFELTTPNGRTVKRVVID